MSPHSVAGTRSFLGFRIIRIQLGKPGAVDTEFWNAPDLDCYPLRQIMEFRDASGKVTDLSDDSVISVSRGEPSADLFSIPADYVERPPSEVERLNAEKTGIPLDQINAARAARIDQRYYESRKYARRRTHSARKGLSVPTASHQTGGQPIPMSGLEIRSNFPTGSSDSL